MRKAIPRVMGSAALAATLLVATTLPSHAAFKDLADDVVEFTLDNGLKFVVVERHDAPVFSFATLVDAGGVDEVQGITGVAHMYEHMAFKGSPTIGTTDYEGEKAALDAVDVAFDEWLTEQRKGVNGNEEDLAASKTNLDAKVAEAREFVKTNEFSQILEKNGVTGLNAGTDSTTRSISTTCRRTNLSCGPVSRRPSGQPRDPRV